MKSYASAGITLGIMAAALASGCGEPASDANPESAPAAERNRNSVDASCSGTIRGRVTWLGDTPRIADFDILPNLVGAEIFHKKQARPNPNAPVIDPETKGVAGAVVFLRSVDGTRTKPWDLGPVRVEQRDAQFHVLQDGGDSHCGFVRRGQRITMLSRDRFLYGLHAGGIAYFSLMFPEPDQPLERVLNQKGIIELSSGVGYFWMRAYVFVDDHPYYARTNNQGGFELHQVPPGRYQLVCWMPSWVEAQHDRDPESRLISRLTFQLPVEQSQSLTLGKDQTKEVIFLFTMEHFKR